ncbi:MAG: PilZ domain-containing protein, partial [Hyphomicrobiaceae bacterium]
SAESSERSGWLAKLDARLPFGPIDFVRFDKGQPFFMRTSGKPQFDAEGNFTGYVGVAYAIPGTSVAAPVERRGAERLPVVRAAEIVLPGDGSIIACVLVDISAAGARLRVPDGIALPETLEMHVPALGQRRQCVLRWRRDGDAGVEFCT